MNAFAVHMYISDNPANHPEENQSDQHGAQAVQAETGTQRFPFNNNQRPRVQNIPDFQTSQAFHMLWNILRNQHKQLQKQLPRGDNSVLPAVHEQGQRRTPDSGERPVD